MGINQEKICALPSKARSTAAKFREAATAAFLKVDIRQARIFYRKATFIHVSLHETQRKFFGAEYIEKQRKQYKDATVI
jgi:hypothetical protein